MGELQKIPGVGKNMEQHLRALGYDAIASLRGADPEEMYARECAMCGASLDRCMYIAARCISPKPRTPTRKNVSGGTGRTDLHWVWPYAKINAGKEARQTRDCGAFLHK